MGYHPRIETKDHTSHCTSRCRNSELWFINNKKLEDVILGQVAKCQKRYSVDIYALAIEGDHIHDLAEYPKLNRAAYKRDTNSVIAKAVAKLVPEYTGGRLWGRRFSVEYMQDQETIEEYFFYVVLQPVQDGLVERISDYPGYNCFHDAITGTKRKFKVVNWTAYNEKKRWCKDVKIRDFTEVYELEYKRLPGYEELSQEEYKRMMLKKLEARRLQVLKQRAANGKVGCLGRERLLKQKPGSRPKHTKTSDRYSHRPRVLSIFNDKRAELREWYFGQINAYDEASRKFRKGDLTVAFPTGMYRPPSFTITKDAT
jgi:REP element-mobilizing transposase RayT